MREMGLVAWGLDRSVPAAGQQGVGPGGAEEQGAAAVEAGKLVYLTAKGRLKKYAVQIRGCSDDGLPINSTGSCGAELAGTGCNYMVSCYVRAKGRCVHMQ